MLILNNEQSIWKKLSYTEKPIVMYGMGDGAIKILKVMAEKGIRPAQFMASDEFVRGHSFQGYAVKKLSEIEAMYDDFIIVVCFGTAISEVMDKLILLSEKYELYAPDVPVIGGGLFDESYIAENKEKLIKVYSLLGDKQSKDTFQNWLDYRISGKIKYLKAMETHKDEAFDILKLGENETYIDCGAYNGDTVKEFLSYTKGKYEKIYALEPDGMNFSKLRRNHYALNPNDFKAINAGVWDKDCMMKFSQKGGRNSAITPFDTENAIRTRDVQMRSVDSVAGNEKISLIKYDVEGSEQQALNGSRQTIQRDKPKLIVSLYHRTEDMVELPLLVNSIYRGYKLYLRHHPYIPAWDTNLYCK